MPNLQAFSCNIHRIWPAQTVRAVRLYPRVVFEATLQADEELKEAEQKKADVKEETEKAVSLARQAKVDAAMAVKHAASSAEEIKVFSPNFSRLSAD